MDLLELFSFAFMATIKFAVLVPLYIVKEELPFWQGFLFGLVSGITGVLFFMYLSTGILIFWKAIVRKLWPTRKSKPTFSKRNRNLIGLKSKFGLWGIAFLSPLLLSLPLGCFLAVRYYKNRWRVFWTMSLGVAFWSAVYAGFGASIVNIINSIRA